MKPTMSVVLPTIGRPQLVRSLKSLRDQDLWPGDEVILVGDGPCPVARALWEQFGFMGRYLEVPGPHKDFGHTPRNLVQPHARGDYIINLDDDDMMVKDGVVIIRKALAENPGRPHLFRMRIVPTNTVLWQVKELVYSNVGTPMIVLPNNQKWGTWQPYYGGDWDYIKETLTQIYRPEDVVWRDEVVFDVWPCPHNTEAAKVRCTQELTSGSTILLGGSLVNGSVNSADGTSTAPSATTSPTPTTPQST